MLCILITSEKDYNVVMNQWNRLDVTRVKVSGMLKLTKLIKSTEFNQNVNCFVKMYFVKVIFHRAGMFESHVLNCINRSRVKMAYRE